MIVLMTDFGQSEYVGILKGVILSKNKKASIIDLTHNIEPQNIIQGSWILKNNYTYFPKKTIFCTIVDPGVGSKRNAIAVQTKNYYFISPDNGLLWETLQNETIKKIIKLPIPKSASKTFHGRDVFAKVAAQISNKNFTKLGENIKTITELSFFKQGNTGQIVNIDHFGNIITNIPSNNKKTLTVTYKKNKIKLNQYNSYSEAKNKPFIIESSNKTFEIAIKNGNAAKKLKINDYIKIKIE